MQKFRSWHLVEQMTMAFRSFSRRDRLQRIDQLDNENYYIRSICIFYPARYERQFHEEVTFIPNTLALPPYKRRNGNGGRVTICGGVSEYHFIPVCDGVTRMHSAMKGITKDFAIIIDPAYLDRDQQNYVRMLFGLGNYQEVGKVHDFKCALEDFVKGTVKRRGKFARI